jgi:hypothetical protein
MCKLLIALLSATSISAAVSTASARTSGGLATGFDAVHQIGWQRAFEVADCTNGNCKYEEPQNPLSSREDGKPGSSSDTVQDCQGGCTKREMPRPMLLADGCRDSNCY